MTSEDDIYKILVLTLLFSIKANVTDGWVSVLFMLIAMGGFLLTAGMYINNSWVEFKRRRELLSEIEDER
jgi:hypothetical protein